MRVGGVKTFSSWIASKFCDGWEQLKWFTNRIRFHGMWWKVCWHGALFVNVSCATGAKQITIAQDIPTELYISRPAISLAPLPTAFTMILVQKPHSMNFSQSPLHAHRRHPSAPPTVLVLPTRTPGLLTLSKPPRPPQRQNQRQTPKPLPKSIPVPSPNPPAKTIDNKKPGLFALPATPSPQPRGRGQVKHTKDRVQIQRWFGIFCLVNLVFFVIWADNTLSF